jgi:hypothetical protein
MKIKYILSAIAIVAFAQNTHAQYYQDALRFSTFQPGATSRIRAIGNAGTAVGGDLSSIGNNPAGLGFFTKSEMSITPEYNGSKVSGNYLGTKTNDSKSSLNLNNAAIVFYSRVNTPRGADKNSGWLSVNFGVGYNRTNNYYENISYGGKNNASSIADYYANLVNDQNKSSGLNTNTIPAAGTLSGFAYDQNLIDFYTASNGFRGNVLLGENQVNNIIRTGGQSQIDFSLGANYGNKFYIGGGFGIATLRYNSLNTFSETGTANVITNANTNPVTTANQSYASSYTQEQETRGTGINAKIGFIYKPVEAVRIGAVFTSPTYYNIQDNYTESLSTRLNGTAAGTDGENYPLEYNLRTPLKVAGGLAVFAGKLGFISGDIEYVDYSSAKLDYDNDNGDNTKIKQGYRGVVNTRFGAEARLTSDFFLRGGYGIQGNPLKTTGSYIKTASGGLGYRFLNYYVDATYTHVTGSQTIYPYIPTSGVLSADLDKKYDNVYLTVGLRF